MECDEFENPADFFLDKLNEAENDLKCPDPDSKHRTVQLKHNIAMYNSIPSINNLIKFH